MPMIIRAKNGTKNQLVIPKLTNVASNGSIGKSLLIPEKIKNSPTSILKIVFNIDIMLKQKNL